MKTHSIGIDFGTTKTLVSHINPQTGVAETIRLGRGCDYVPSSVYVEANGHFLFGDDADDLVEDETGVYLRGFKMKLGSSTPLHMCMGGSGMRMLTAKDLVYEYLRYIKHLVEEKAFMGESVTKAVITRPVNFTPAQSEELKHAAQAAGFSNVEFTSEPEAAGLAFCRLQSAHAFKGNALVVDWGGGTLDFALVSRKGDTVSTHRSHTDGDTTMGGEVFDERLWMYVNMEMKKQGVSLNPVAMLPKVRSGKEQLSARDSINLRLSHPQGVTTLPLARNVFNCMIASDVDKAVEKAKTLLKNIPAALKPEMLLLVGGSSQIPLIKEKLEKACALPAKYWANSREAVALGAALWGKVDDKQAATELIQQCQQKMAGETEESDKSIKLVNAGKNKLNVFNAIREICPNLGLAQAKKLVESAPVVLPYIFPHQCATTAARILSRAGARVEIINYSQSDDNSLRIAQDKGNRECAELIQQCQQKMTGETEEVDKSIKLVNAGKNKLNVFNAIREICPNLGLAQAKKLVESAPVVLPYIFPHQCATTAARILSRAGARVEIINYSQSDDNYSEQYSSLVEHAVENLNSDFNRHPLELRADFSEIQVLETLEKYINRIRDLIDKKAQPLSKQLSQLLLNNGFVGNEAVFSKLRFDKNASNNMCEPLRQVVKDCLNKNSNSSVAIADSSTGEIVGGIAGGIIGVLTLGVATPITAYAGAQLGKAVAGIRVGSSGIDVSAAATALPTVINHALPVVLDRFREHFYDFNSTSSSAQNCTELFNLIVCDELGKTMTCIEKGNFSKDVLKRALSYAHSETMKKLISRYL